MFKDSTYRNITYYQSTNSRFWWVRIRLNGTYIRQTTKEEDKKLAVKKGKEIFLDILSKERVDGEEGKGKKYQFNIVAIRTIDYLFEQKRQSDGTIKNIRGCINNVLIPHFGNKDIRTFKYSDMTEFLDWLYRGAKGKKRSRLGVGIKDEEEGKIATNTQKHYWISFKHVMDFALRSGLVDDLPTIPPFRKTRDDKDDSIKRDFFTYGEYLSLLDFIKKYKKKPQLNEKNGKSIKYPIDDEFEITVKFLINSYLRVSDLKVLKWKDVHVRENEDRKNDGFEDYRYLYLTHPATKTIDTPVTTRTTCYKLIMKDLVKFRKTNKRNGKTYLTKDDYVFFPWLNEIESKNKDPRKYAINLIANQFKNLTNEWKVKHKPKYDNRDFVLYSLRHSSILFALEYGGVDVFTIAKNSRTGVLMIEKHYGKYYLPDSQRNKLQSSKREKERWEEQRRDYVESGVDSGDESTSNYHKKYDGFKYEK